MITRFSHKEASGIELEIAGNKFRAGWFRLPKYHACGNIYKTRGGWQIRLRKFGIAFRASTFAVIVLALTSC